MMEQCNTLVKFRHKKHFGLVKRSTLLRLGNKYMCSAQLMLQYPVWPWSFLKETALLKTANELHSFFVGPSIHPMHHITPPDFLICSDHNYYGHKRLDNES